MTGIPSLLLSKFVPLLRMDGSSGISRHEHWSLSVNTEGIDGERKGGAHGQGPKATAFWNPGSKWHLLLLWPKKEQVHLFDSFADIRIRLVSEKKLFSSSGGLLFCKEYV